MDIIVVIIFIILSSLLKKITRNNDNQTQSFSELLDKKVLPTVNKSQRSRDVELPLKNKYREKNLQKTIKNDNVKEIQTPMENSLKVESMDSLGFKDNKLWSEEFLHTPSSIQVPSAKIKTGDLQKAVITKEILDKPLALRS